MEPAVSIIVPPGIGDISWVYSKLLSLGRPLDVLVPRSNHNRALPYLELLPMVREASCGRAMNPAKQARQNAQPDWTAERLLTESRERPVPIELNRWLEAGNRIEDFMPELPTIHHYPLVLDGDGVADAEHLLLGRWERFVCLYCANRDAVRRWGGWKPAAWADLASGLWGALDLDGFVLLGAGWDRSFTDRVIEGLAKELPLLNLVGRTSLSGTLHVLRRSLYLVAFASGIPILATVMRVPNLMLYPAHLERMIGAWPPEDMTESGAHKGTVFCEPSEAVDWIINGYGLVRAFEEV